MKLLDKFRQACPSNLAFYRAQEGVDTPAGFEETVPLVIVLADAFMVDKLAEYGHGGPVILDFTHGTNKYAFNLLVVVVVDDDNEGVPVAFALTSRQTTESVAVVMQAVRFCCLKS